MKKILRCIFSVIFSFIIVFGCVGLSDAETKNSYTTRTVLKSEVIKKNVALCWHPQFERYNKVDGYYFSTKNKQNVQISLSAGIGQVIPVSVSVQKAEGQSAGTMVKASSEKWSRPKIYGDIVKDTVKIRIYNRRIRTRYKEYIKYEYRSENTYIKPIYKN